MRQEVTDDHRFDRGRAVSPVDIHAHLEPVDEDHQARRQFACLDGRVKTPGHDGDAGQASARSVEPIDDREAAGLVGIGGRAVEMVTDVSFRRGAGEDMVGDTWRRDGAGHPCGRTRRRRRLSRDRRGPGRRGGRRAPGREERGKQHQRREETQAHPKIKTAPTRKLPDRPSYRRTRKTAPSRIAAPSRRRVMTAGPTERSALPNQWPTTQTRATLQMPRVL